MRIFKANAVKVALALAVVSAITAAGFIFGDPDSDEVTVTAMLPDASPLIPGNLVRASGIEVGEIESVDLRNGQAAVQMKLDPVVLPLHKDASVKIRPVTLLGERFIELNRGSPNSPVMNEPRVIQAKQTSRSVDLDEVLNSVNKPTSTALAALATTLGEGVGAQGGQVDSAIKALAPAMQNTQQLGAILNQQNSVLNQLVDRSSPVAEAAAGRNSEQLDHMVDSTKRALHAVGTQHQALREAVKQLPATLTNAQRVLSQAAGVAESGTPTLRAARPVTDNLPQISRELNAFADSANPALASLPKVLNKAKTLLDAARPVTRDLRPGAQALPGISSSGHRLVRDLTPAMGTALDFMKYWAMSTNGRDALSNYFRAFVVTTPKSLLQVPGIGLPPGQTKQATAGPRGARPGAASQETGPLPAPGAPLLGNGGSATGLNPLQEGSLVDQLLGGR